MEERMIPVLKRNLNQYRIAVVLILGFLFMSFVSEYFMTARNIREMLNSINSYGIAAVGLTFVLITGLLDISVGSIIAMTGVIFALTFPQIGMIGAMVISLICALSAGTLTGTLVACLDLNPFIVSLSAQLAYKGIALVLAGSKPIPVIDVSVSRLGSMHVSVFPIMFFVFLIVVAASQIVLTRTQFGRNLFAIGGNKEVAKSVGINLKKHQILAFSINGFLSGVAGLTLVVRLCSADGTVASDAALTVIPMVIIGGTSFSGGKGSAVKTLLGALMIGLIFNAMSMFNIYTNIQNLVKGIILLAIIVSDKYLEHKEERV